MRFETFIKILLLGIPALNSALMVLGLFTHSPAGLMEEKNNQIINLHLSSLCAWVLVGVLGYMLLYWKFEEKNRVNSKTD